jgi:serine/threonine protein phosphatase PrpC
VELTHDHKLENPEEKARIEAAGGWIKPSEVEPYFAPARVYKDKKNRKLGPGLTMSRSLGDLDADEIGVIATPEVAFYSLAKGRDRFIVLASDGVWEFLSSADVVNIVGGFLNRGEPAINAARFLIAKAAVAWASDGDDYRDDITAIVIFLDSLPGALGTA